MRVVGGGGAGKGVSESGGEATHRSCTLKIRFLRHSLSTQMGGASQPSRCGSPGSLPLVIVVQLRFHALLISHDPCMTAPTPLTPLPHTSSTPFPPHLHGDDLPRVEAQLFVVIQHRVHVFDPDRVNRAVQHQPLSVSGCVPAYQRSGECALVRHNDANTCFPM